MTELIVCLTDKTGTNHIKALIERNEWDSTSIITNEKMASEFDAQGNLNMIIIDSSKPTESIVREIIGKLKVQLLQQLHVTLDILRQVVSHQTLLQTWVFFDDARPLLSSQFVLRLRTLKFNVSTSFVRVIDMATSSHGLW